MELTDRKIRLRKSLEVHTIVGQQRFIMTGRIRQLLSIAATELPCFLETFVLAGMV